MRRWAILLLAVGAMPGCVSLEDRLVYHPHRTPAHLPALPEPLQDLPLRTSDGIKVQARWCPYPGSDRAILYLHGNAGNLEGRGKIVHDLWRSQRASILIVDYPGFGRSEGTPSEAGCYAAAQAAYDWLIGPGRRDPGRIAICGESLGGGVAVELASRNSHGALVLVRTFTSLPEVATAHYPWVPAHLLMKNRFDNLAGLGKCTRPTLIAQADQDRLIPYDHGEKLRRAAEGPAELFPLLGLGHNDPLPESFLTHLRGFLVRAIP